MNFRKVLRENNKNVLISFVSLCLLYSFHGTVFNGIPFIFYRPEIFCTINGITNKCSEETMCQIKQQQLDNPSSSSSTSSSSSYHMNSYNSILSIPIEYDLFCERKVIEAQMQTLSTLGQLAGFILSLLIDIPQRKKLTVILSTLYLECACLMTVQILSKDYIFPVFFALFAQNACFSYFYALLFVFASERFSADLGAIAPILTNFLWAFTMLIYIIYAYYAVYWRNHLLQFAAIPLFTLTLIFHYFIKKQERQDQLQQISLKSSELSQPLHEQFLQEEQLISHALPQQQSDQTQQSVLESLKQRMIEIYSDKQQWKNLKIYMLCNAGCYISYFGVYLSLNRLEGNIYVNSFGSTLFELSGGISVAVLISRYKPKQILFYIYLLIGFSYLSCLVFQSFDEQNQSTLALIVSLLPIIVAKATHEMLFPIFIIYLPYILLPKYHQFAFAAANLVGVMTMNILPFYQYFMEMYGINQFFGYGLFMFLVVFQIGNIQEINCNNGQDRNSHSENDSNNSAENNCANKNYGGKMKINHGIELISVK